MNYFKCPIQGHEAYDLNMVCIDQDCKTGLVCAKFQKLCEHPHKLMCLENFYQNFQNQSNNEQLIPQNLISQQKKDLDTKFQALGNQLQQLKSQHLQKLNLLEKNTSISTELSNLNSKKSKSIATTNQAIILLKPYLIKQYQDSLQLVQINSIPDNSLIEKPLQVMLPEISDPIMKYTNHLCAFCNQQSMTGNSLFGPFKGLKGEVVVTHYLCARWSSGIVYNEITRSISENIAKEAKRARQLYCFLCKQKGASVGCIVKTCNRSFHQPCCEDSKSGCKLQRNKYWILCSKHADVVDLEANAEELEEQLKEAEKQDKKTPRKKKNSYKSSKSLNALEIEKEEEEEEEEEKKEEEEEEEEKEEVNESEELNQLAEFKIQKKVKKQN